MAERIAAAEGVVQSLVEEYEASDGEDPSHHSPFDTSNDLEGHFINEEDSDDDDALFSAQQGVSGSDGSASIEERFHGLEEEVATLVADVHDLALYTKLNFTGFIKIVKVRYPSYKTGHLR